MRFIVAVMVSAVGWMTAGCGKDEIRVYQAPQEAPQNAPQNAPAVAVARTRTPASQGEGSSPAAGSTASGSASELAAA